MFSNINSIFFIAQTIIIDQTKIIYENYQSTNYMQRQKSAVYLTGLVNLMNRKKVH